MSEEAFQSSLRHTDLLDRQTHAHVHTQLPTAVGPWWAALRGSSMALVAKGCKSPFQKSLDSSNVSLAGLQLLSAKTLGQEGILVTRLPAGLGRQF